MVHLPDFVVGLGLPGTCKEKYAGVKLRPSTVNQEAAKLSKGCNYLEANHNPDIPPQAGVGAEPPGHLDDNTKSNVSV